MIVDKIGKYEHLDQEVAEIAREMGLGEVALKKVNASQRGSYRDFYDASGLALVKELYARDFALFDYDDALELPGSD